MRKIQILGTGCAKCRKLHEHAEDACREASLACEVEKVEEIDRILEFGVMMTPALVIDGEVKAVGKVVSKNDILKMLTSG